MTTTPSPTPLILRLVAGWMFLSAAHRRLVLAPGKLDPDSASYLGHKFNQFMPGAIGGVDRLIAALLDAPSALHAFLWSFTIIEGLVGLALIFGLGTRLAAVGSAAMSVGILLGAGWLGPTCLDEWQIGALGGAVGSALMLTGAGAYSLDAEIARRWPELMARPWLRALSDPAPRAHAPMVLAVAVAAFGLTVGTNQIFHGGVWGPLHNDSVSPQLRLEGAVRDAEGLRFTVERPAGPETYGAFIVEVRHRSDEGEVMQRWGAAALSRIERDAIANRWLVQVQAGVHGLEVPLGARAEVRLPGASTVPGGRLELEDVSGKVWTVPVRSS